METKKAVAKILLDIKAVSLSPKKPFTFTSGVISPIYTDCRVVMSHVKEREEVTKALKDIIVNEIGLENVDTIAGVSTSGIPYAAWLAKDLNLPMVYVRSSAKDYGKHNAVEGVLKKGDKAVLVEDLVSTAGSSIKCVKAIRELGGVIDHQISIFTYEFDSSKENFNNEKITAHPLTNISTLVDVAVAENYLQASEKDLVLSWKSSPNTWGK